MYYFPFGKKHVTLSDIEYIEAKTPTLLNGKWRIWGTGDFITWFPCDSSRPIRDTIFIAHLKNRIVRIGFTVEESGPVINFFSEKRHSKKFELKLNMTLHPTPKRFAI
jgi:hypothetical protein